MAPIPHLLRQALATTALTGLLLSTSAPAIANDTACPEPGQWLRLKPSAAIASISDLLNNASRQRVVLLGEQHDSAAHHAWQLHTLAALHARQPRMVIGFESFPRRAQGVLDRWVAGELSEVEFLRETQWEKVWGFDAALYMPLFQFARMHRVPMRALNVDRDLVRRTGENGWAAIPDAERQGVGDPQAAPPAYLEILHRAYRAHDRSGADSGDLADPGFRKFVDSMLLWDGAMAEALAQPLLRGNAKLAVGIVGRGHVEHGHGIARQLAAQGIADVMAVLPWDASEKCAPPPAGIADAVFSITPIAPAPSGPRLGIELSQAEGAIAIMRVMDGSIAQQTGLRAGDVIHSVAGRETSLVQDVIAAVRRQAPGTWLPIVVRRDGETLDFVAKFPPAP